MPRKLNEHARILNFFSEADVLVAETVYNLVRDVMAKRLAPAKAARKAQRKKKGPAEVPTTAA